MIIISVVVLMPCAWTVIVPGGVDDAVGDVSVVGLAEPPTVVKLPVTQVLVRLIALERTRQ